MRLPIAGPYRPWARLYRLPDGRLAFRVRLWEVDRPVARYVDPEVVRAFARRHRLRPLEAAVDELLRVAGEKGGRP